MAMISIVIPVFNETEVIDTTYQRLKQVMDSLSSKYELIFVNDGSQDDTAQKIKGFAEKDKSVKLLSFSRNFGHQSAISAGMDYASGDAVVVIDADLQDPPEVIPQMIEKWQEGYEVVYGKRLKRKGETLFKKVTAKLFYRLLKHLTNVEIPVDTGDFRLIDRKVCDIFCRLQEKNRFIRGLVSWIGFRQTYVEYIREERFAGETKYPLKKMLRFAMDGILSFSYVPLKIASLLGFLVSGASFLYLIFVLMQKLFYPVNLVPGWTSIVAVLLIFNGLVLILLGVIGEYIGRIYDEVRNRPLYIINQKVNFEDEGMDETH